MIVLLKIGDHFVNREMVRVHMADENRIHVIIRRYACHQGRSHFDWHQLIDVKSIRKQRIKQDLGMLVANHDPFISEISGLR